MEVFIHFITSIYVTCHVKLTLQIFIQIIHPSFIQLKTLIGEPIIHQVHPYSLISSIIKLGFSPFHPFNFFGFFILFMF